MDNLQLKLGEKITINIKGKEIQAIVSSFLYKDKSYYWNLTILDGDVTYAVK